MSLEDAGCFPLFFLTCHARIVAFFCKAEVPIPEVHVFGCVGDSDISASSFSFGNSRNHCSVDSGVGLDWHKPLRHKLLSLAEQLTVVFEAKTQPIFYPLPTPLSCVSDFQFSGPDNVVILSAGPSCLQL